MTKLSFSLPLTVCVYIASSHGGSHGFASALATPSSSRRSFLSQAAVATTGGTMGWVLTQQQQQLQHPGGCACGQCGGSTNNLAHSASCDCGMCTGSHVAGCQCGSCLAAGHGPSCSCGMCSSMDGGGGHEAGCGCGQCDGLMAQGGRLGFRPPSAYAFEKRVIGGDGRSAETAAFNIQNEKTYARLEKSGFPLDTRADEQARLSEALSTFSYPAASGQNLNTRKSNDKIKK